MSGKMDKMKKRIFKRNVPKGKDKMMWVNINVSKTEKKSAINWARKKTN
jgi:hypothetical protein